MALLNGDRDNVSRASKQSKAVLTDARLVVTDEKLAKMQQTVAEKEHLDPSWPDDAALRELEREWIFQARFIQEGYEVGAFTEEGVKIALEERALQEIVDSMALRIGYASLRILRLAALVRQLRAELEQADTDRETAWAALGRKP